MSKRTFVVAVDAADPAANTVTLRRAILDNPDVLDWWNHIPGVFLVTTEKNADELSASVYTRSKISRFLVIEANLSHSEGLLPDQAWKWIQQRSDGQVPSDAASADMA